MNRPFYIFIFLLLFCCEAKTQTNLVYNGDFEIYDTCPTNPSTPSDLQIDHCLGWTSPTKMATSDYFNICNNSLSQLAGVPLNLLGYQAPYNGNGYCGIFAWNVSLSSGSINYREYLQTKLIQKLEPSKTYSLTFYVSFYGANYSLTKIGALFSQNNYNSNGYTPIIATPQIVNQNSTLGDSLNWMKIEGIFTATGNEEFLTIGYFEDTLSVSDTLNIYKEPLVFLDSYYFIDGVNLIEIPCSLVLPNVFTPNQDGVNDVLKFTSCDDIIKTTIYNRWGNKVFETDEVNHYWEGRTTSGEECVNGNYYYIVETKEKNIKGFVQLIR